MVLLIVAFALITSCTNSASNGNATSTTAPTGGSNANPQTNLKKQTGGS
jgi:hypothetical protein